MKKEVINKILFHVFCHPWQNTIHLESKIKIYASLIIEILFKD